MKPEAEKELGEMAEEFTLNYYEDWEYNSRDLIASYRAGFLARNRMLEALAKNWPANTWLIYMRILEMVNEINRFRGEE